MQMKKVWIARRKFEVLFLAGMLMMTVTISACVPLIPGGLNGGKGDPVNVGGPGDDDGNGGAPGNDDGGNGEDPGESGGNEDDPGNGGENGNEDGSNGEEPGENGGNEGDPGHDDGGNGETVTLSLPIANGSDLGWREGQFKENEGRSTYRLNVNPANIWFGGGLDSYDTDAFLRWDNVQIEPGATITKAYITVISSARDVSNASLNTHPVRVDIAAFAMDDLPSFSQIKTDGDDTRDLPRTTAHVFWGINESWRAIEWTERETPDIAAVIQEVVDRPGWSKGNALGIAFDSYAYVDRDRYHREICAFNDNFGRCPLVGGQPVLFVEYVR